MDKEDELKEINVDAEDVLEYLYEISDKYKKTEDPIESMKADLRTMIRYFKDEKFDKINDKLGVEA